MTSFKKIQNNNRTKPGLSNTSLSKMLFLSLMGLLLYIKIAELREEDALFWGSPRGMLWPCNRVTGDRSSLVSGNLAMEPKLVGSLISTVR